jgi:hypothetical protein
MLVIISVRYLIKLFIVILKLGSVRGRRVHDVFLRRKLFDRRGHCVRETEVLNSSVREPESTVHKETERHH